MLYSSPFVHVYESVESSLCLGKMTYAGTQPGVGSLSGMSTEERKRLEEVRQEVKMWEPSSKETQRGREMERQ